MKVLAILLVVVLLALGLVYQLSFAGFDPVEQAENFKANAKPGMSWQDVAKLHEPKKYIPFSADFDRPRRSEQDYDEAKLAEGIKRGSYSEGFCFVYFFTADHAYEAMFDGKGVCTEVVPIKTGASLFQMPDTTP